jgi:hypothetical protein
LQIFLDIGVFGAVEIDEGAGENLKAMESHPV